MKSTKIFGLVIAGILLIAFITVPTKVKADGTFGEEIGKTITYIFSFIGLQAPSDVITGIILLIEAIIYGSIAFIKDFFVWNPEFVTGIVTGVIVIVVFSYLILLPLPILVPTLLLIITIPVGIIVGFIMGLLDWLQVGRVPPHLQKTPVMVPAIPVYI